MKSKHKKPDLGALKVLLVPSLVQPVILSVVKGVGGREVRRAGRGYTNENL